MSQPKLRRPEQSLPVWLLYGLFEFAASLKLAVILIFGMAFVLGLATFVEARYGTATVQWSMYQTWWFDLLNLALAVNIFAAAAIRYPWKRHQTGFVVTHIGLLTLLFGCWMQRVGGVDAQIPILEDGRNRFFYEDDLSFAFKVTPKSPGERAANDAAAAKSSGGSEFLVPFHGGPFNWDLYSRLQPGDAAARQDWLGAMANLAFQNARRDVGPIRDAKLASEGISLEVLDYWSNSQSIEAPSVKLELSTPQPKPGITPTAEELSRFGAPQWMSFDLAVQPSKRPPAGREDLGQSDRQSAGGGTIVFWLAGADDEVKSFLEGPDIDKLGLGDQGQVVLVAKGKTYRLRVDQHVGKEKFPLGDSGLEVEVVKHYAHATVDDFDPDTGDLYLREAASPDDRGAVGPGVTLVVYGPEGKKQRITRLADYPDEGRGTPTLGVYASYWVDRSGKTSLDALAGRSGARLDLIASPDLKLYHRRFGRRTTPPPPGSPADQAATTTMFFEAGPLPDDGQPRPAFEMPRFQSQMRVLPGGFVPRTTPGRERVPATFDKKLDPSGAERMVKLRLKIGDSVNEEFWLRSHGLIDDQIMQSFQSRTGKPVGGDSVYTSDQKRVFTLPDRTIELTLPSQQIEIGYNIKLDHVEQELDPGTNQPSHYGSQFDLVAPSGSEAKNVDDVRIVMNAPKDFTDPTTGRSYRLFQEGINGPIDGADGRKRYFTILTVNYDPGRGVKYLGCLLIVAGIAIMFYMKAYFFKSGQKKAADAKRSRGDANARGDSATGGKALAGAGAGPRN